MTDNGHLTTDELERAAAWDRILKSVMSIVAPGRLIFRTMRPDVRLELASYAVDGHETKIAEWTPSARWILDVFTESDEVRP